MSSSKKYYKLPEPLLSSGLSARAIICYCILADRQELSSKNATRYSDGSGLYILYPIKELAAKLGTGERTTRYALAELEDAGLIRTRKQGKKAPQRIYVEPPTAAVSGKKATVKNLPLTEGSDRQEFAAHERQDFAAPYSYTDNNKTDITSSTATAAADTPPDTPDTPDTPPETQPTTYLPTLIAMIDRAAAQLGRKIDDVGRIRVLNRYRKAKSVSSPQAWITAVIKNLPLADLCGHDKDSKEGYAPTYSIEEYESTSVLDEDW